MKNSSFQAQLRYFCIWNVFSYW